MADAFSGYPKTAWAGNRNMELLEDFSYRDPDGRLWSAPRGSFLNGATIPKALWSTIGSPFVGKYRRASVVHDYAVGEGSNPDVSFEDRRKADRMFYNACLDDGCSKKFAGVLYIGVSLGSWSSWFGSVFRFALDKDDEDIGESPEDKMIKMKFEQMYNDMEDELETMDFEELEKRVNDTLVLGRR